MGFIETAYSGNPTLKDLDINADLDLKNDYDAIGIKRFICQDYLGAILAEADENIIGHTLILDDVPQVTYTKKFRAPSNFMPNSTVKLKLHVRSGSSANKINLYSFDPDTSTYTNEGVIITIPSPTNSIVTTDSFVINPGVLYALRSNNTSFDIYGSEGVQVCYSSHPYNDSIWDVID